MFGVQKIQKIGQDMWCHWKRSQRKSFPRSRLKILVIWRLDSVHSQQIKQLIREDNESEWKWLWSACNRQTTAMSRRSTQKRTTTTHVTQWNAVFLPKPNYSSAKTCIKKKRTRATISDENEEEKYSDVKRFEKSFAFELKIKLIDKRDRWRQKKANDTHDSAVVNWEREEK